MNILICLMDGECQKSLMYLFDFFGNGRSMGSKQGFDCRTWRDDHSITRVRKGTGKRTMLMD